MVARLDDDTRGHRAETDRDLDHLFAPDTIAPHYLLFLMRAYGFEAPLECAFAGTAGLDVMLDLRLRAKAGLIAADLLALGLRPPEVADLPQCLSVPQFRGVAEAIGWLYMIERQTLLHGVLHRHLATRLPQVTGAGSYLSCYESVAGRRWSELSAVIDRVATTRALEDRIIAAAHAAYLCHRRWVHQDVGRRAAS
jgi:heme oxygenase